jgi:predicted amidohydrolase
MGYLGMGMQVALAQIPVSWSVESNLETILGAIEDIDEGTLLVLPEAALSGYDDELSGLSGLNPDEIDAGRGVIASAAREREVHVVCGSLIFEREQWWNAAMYFSPSGSSWIYRKVNLAMHEREKLAAGSSLPTFDVDLLFGRTTIGVQLCREIRFPEQWRSLALRGASVLIYMTYAANPALPVGVWRSHLISRAAETQRFVLAVNVADINQHCPTMIISPRGEVIIEASTLESTILRGEIDLTEIRDDYLHQRREDLI